MTGAYWYVCVEMIDSAIRAPQWAALGLGPSCADGYLQGERGVWWALWSGKMGSNDGLSVTRQRRRLLGRHGQPHGGWRAGLYHECVCCSVMTRIPIAVAYGYT